MGSDNMSINVMKRYCDFDYDNCCIILFDAEEEQALDDDINISWIGSCENAKDKTEQKDEEKVPFKEYLETKYEQKMSKLAQQRTRQQQQRNSQAAPSVFGMPSPLKGAGHGPMNRSSVDASLNFNYLMNLQTVQQVNYLNNNRMMPPPMNHHPQAMPYQTMPMAMAPPLY